MKKTEAVRKTRVKLADKIALAQAEGVDHGRKLGREEARLDFGPNWQHQKNITDLVRMIESWGLMSDEAVIMIAGTDLKHHSHAAVPYRLMKVVGEELKRLGYKP